ncbi:hypothetical protein K438DRAFT_1807814 [Mycena galopus ATCC 62051]|nr:hypothetical protein K438DRAFT_1807814 [Mycena galopus ATCC 62051]
MHLILCLGPFLVWRILLYTYITFLLLNACGTHLHIFLSCASVVPFPSPSPSPAFTSSSSSLIHPPYSTLS